MLLSAAIVACVTFYDGLGVRESKSKTNRSLRLGNSFTLALCRKVNLVRRVDAYIILARLGGHFVMIDGFLVSLDVSTPINASSRGFWRVVEAQATKDDQNIPTGPDNQLAREKIRTVEPYVTLKLPRKVQLLVGYGFLRHHVPGC